MVHAATFGPMSNPSAEQIAKIAEYREAVHTVVLCARRIAIHDIPAILESIERADIVGPMIDPTLWREKHKAMNQDREVLRAALALHEIGAKLVVPVSYAPPIAADVREREAQCPVCLYWTHYQEENPELVGDHSAPRVKGSEIPIGELHRCIGSGQRPIGGRYVMTDPRVSDEYGYLWYLCCKVKWSPTATTIPGSGYGALVGIQHVCGTCKARIPSDFLARAVLVDIEREKVKASRGVLPPVVSIESEDRKS